MLAEATPDTVAPTKFYRSFDAASFNVIANDPDVRPHLGGEGELDLTRTIENADNFLIRTDGGGFIAVKMGSGYYETHTISRPGSFSEMLELGRYSLAYMFIHTDCLEIFTRVPEGNAGAMVLAKRLGFKDYYVQKDWSDGKSATVMQMTLDSWVFRSTDALIEGRLFHDSIAHVDEDRHDRCAGAALLMAKAGNVVKGFATYDRLSKAHGYETANLISVQPPLIRMGNSVIGLNDGKVEVMKCL